MGDRLRGTGTRNMGDRPRRTGIGNRGMGGESTKREREQGELTERKREQGTGEWERAIDRERKGEGTGNSEQRTVLGE